MAPPLLPLVRPLIAVPVAIRAANTIMGLMVMQGITMSMWRGMLNKNIPSVDMRSSRPHLTFEMTNRQPTPPSPPPAVTNTAAIDSYYPSDYYQHKHKQQHDHGYDEYEPRPRRKNAGRKEVQVVQMIPIVQPIQIPAAVASLPSSHSPTHSLSVSTHAASPEPQQHLLSYQAVQQSPQSPMLVIPAFGQAQGGGSRILIQAVSAPTSDRSASLPAGDTSPALSPFSPLPPAAQPAFMIMASGSSPSVSYDKGSRDDGLRAGSASAAVAASGKRRKRKSKKKVIVLSIKGAEPLNQQHRASAAELSVSSPEEKEEEEEGRHRQSCTPSDERSTCRPGDKSDKGKRVMPATGEEVDQEEDADDGSMRHGAGDVGEGRSFLFQGKHDVVALLPEKEIAQKDAGVPLSSTHSAHSTTLSPPLILSSPDPDTGNHTRSSGVGGGSEALAGTSPPATGREQSPSTTPNKPDHEQA